MKFGLYRFGIKSIGSVHIRGKGSGFVVQAERLRVEGRGFGVQGLGFRVQGLEFRGWGSRLGAKG